VSDFSLAGRRAVVTGAGRGLGRAIALALARHGADLAGYSRTPDELDSLKAEISALGRRFVAVPGAVDVPADVARLRERVEATFGGADILVKYAGISHVEPALEVTPAHWSE